MRALIVTNMYPSPAHPALGSFVRDQVEALRRLDDVEVALFAFEPGGVGAYAAAARALRRRRGEDNLDVVIAVAPQMFDERACTGECRIVEPQLLGRFQLGDRIRNGLA